MISVSTDEESFRAAVDAAISEGPDHILVWGGDGSINQVLEPLIKAGIPLGIIPGGSANIMARELSIPLDPYEACEY